MNAGRAVVLKSLVDAAIRTVGLFLFPVIARTFGPDGYGAYTQLFVLVGFMAPIASLGLANSIGRFTADGPWTAAHRHTLAKALLTVLVASTCVSVVAAASAESINALFLRWKGGEALFLWGSPLIVLAALEALLLEVLRARDQLGAYISYQASQALILSAAIGSVLVTDVSLVAVIQQIVLARLAVLLITALSVFVMPTVNDTTRDRSLGQMIRYGAPLIGVGFGLWLTNLVDRFVIGHHLGAESVGRYAAAYAVSSLLLAVAAAIHLPAYPRILRATIEDGGEALDEVVRHLHRYTTLVLVPSAVLLTVLTPRTLRLLGGADFEVSPALSVLLVASMFVGQWNALAHYVLRSYDQTRYLLKVWLIAGVANLGMNLILVPIFGILGAATATLGTFIWLEISAYRRARRFIQLKHCYDFKYAARLFAISLPAGLCARLALSLGGDDMMSVLVATAAFALTFTPLALLTKAVTHTELSVVARVFRR